MSPVRAKNSTRAFTLIELLVVIGLIAILIAATLSVIPKVKRAVYGASTQSQLAAIATAIQAYYNDFHAYPGPLANNQLNWSYDSVPANQPGITVPNYSGSGTNFLGLGSLSPSPFSNNNYNPQTGAQFSYKITSSQNLVLGLLGGLEFQTNTSGQVTNFIYNPLDLFATDGVTPTPRGPSSLNPASPRRQQAYLQVKPGDISVPNVNANAGTGTSFIDEAGRSPNDAMLPVFLDKYGSPLPILYYRTNVGGTAITGLRSTSTAGAYTDDSNNVLTDPNTGANLIAQYDLVQNLPYVQSQIGLVKSAVHGLQGVGNSPNLTDVIDTTTGGVSTPSNNGKNGLAYFKDPSLNTNLSTNTNGQGVARQKDGFVLISAGPDRQYGTHDDLIYPGPLQP
jgi:prepilin-type N-terminal cleavage/methylation domain-containing protein